mmetsp:Transcript_9530/g.28415  ORF Transcript_9530/g.28415 Transcript_9530/m.28415 type:complete len:337 (+) Transcript_9530:123-1133(+)
MVRQEENSIWAAFAEPLNSLVASQQKSVNNEETKKKAVMAEYQEDTYRKRYRKRLQSLQTEIDEVNEDATTTRKKLWETQDKLKSAEDQIRKLENHLNEVLELREKDMETVKTLRAANSDCVEMESRAREAMEVFKKCYKRAQLKIKEQEEETALLREQNRAARDRSEANADTANAGVNKSALEYIKSISEEKEKRLKKMVFETEKEVDLWKSRYRVASKRCSNLQEHIEAAEHPSEATVHMNKQRIKIEQLEEALKVAEEKQERQRREYREEKEEQDEQEERDDDHDDSNHFSGGIVDDIVHRAFCDEDLRGSLTKDLVKRLQVLNCTLPTMANV